MRLLQPSNPMNEAWNPLYWQSFELLYRAARSGPVGAQKASAWRGLFGHALRNHHPHLYPILFENRISPSHPYARRYQTGPVPYLCKVQDNRRFLQRGDSLSVQLTLFGNSRDQWEALQPVLQQLGQRGLGPQRIPLSWEGFEAGPTMRWQDLKALPGGDRVCLDLVSPLLIKKALPEPLELPLSWLIHRLAERAMLMAHFFCGGILSDDFEALKQLANQARPGHASLFLEPVYRYSSRQAAPLNMKGIQGQLCFQTLPPELVPLLRLGRYLHLGSGCSWGMGELHCTWQASQVAAKLSSDVRKNETTKPTEDQPLSPKEEK